MPTTTSRLGLAQPLTTDAATEYRAAITGNAATLDNAALYTEGTLAARPAAGSVEHGHIYRSTDTHDVSWSNGTSWIPLVQAGGPVGHLIPTNKTTTYTAVAGDLVLAQNGSSYTVTLPAPVAGAVVGVFVYGAGTGVITVSAGSAVVYGAGLGSSGSSSFKLGTAGATATVVSDGANWFIRAGQQDTGWVALTIGTGMSADTSDGSTATPGARTVGDIVRLRGMLKNTSGGSLVLPTVATLPLAAMHPANGQFFGGQQLEANPSGTLGYAGSLAANGLVALDGVKIELFN